MADKAVADVEFFKDKPHSMAADRLTPLIRGFDAVGAWLDAADLEKLALRTGGALAMAAAGAGLAARTLSKAETPAARLGGRSLHVVALGAVAGSAVCFGVAAYEHS